MPTVFNITRTADKRVAQEPQIKAALERGEEVIAKARGVQFACRLNGMAVVYEALARPIPGI